MDIIGIICEYNPFHNGHIYHIDRIKEMYPNSLIILALNGYFLERGEISILSKEEKINIALENRIDIVIEIPFVFGSESADTFAESATIMLNYLGCKKLIFGSESNDINLLTNIAKIQLDNKINKKIKDALDKGVNYPTALNKATGIDIKNPNDLLGISYIKSIIKNNLKIEPICIKRTNDYHDTLSNDKIISASNIREKIKNKENISKYTNYQKNITLPDEDLLFKLLKTKIITEHNLSTYLGVDEGIEHKIIKVINEVNNIDDLINKVKSKRYTYNRIRRMFIHILIGLTKNDRKLLYTEYVKLLGFNSKGQQYLKNINKDILIARKIPNTYLAEQYELKAATIYELLTNKNVLIFEKSNKPIKKDS